jgi:hypothetical protein
MRPTPVAAFGRLPLKGATPADRQSRIRGVRVVGRARDGAMK